MHFLKIQVVGSSEALAAARSAFNAGLVRAAPYESAQGSFILSGYAESSAPVAAARVPGVTITLLEDTGGVELPQVVPQVFSGPSEVLELKVPENLASDSEEAPPQSTCAFAVRLSGPYVERSVLVDAGSLVTQALAGLVTFAKPPTQWADDAWTISGRGVRATVKAVVREVTLPHGVKAAVTFA